MTPQRIVVRFDGGRWLLECDGMPVQSFRTQGSAVERATDVSAAFGGEELLVFARSGIVRTFRSSRAPRRRNSGSELD